jgi:AAA domain-containing protein
MPTEVTAFDSAYDQNITNFVPPKASAPSPIQLISFGEMSPRLDDRSIIGGTLQSGGLSLLVGVSGSTKSFLALDMALHIAGGRDWFGHPTQEAGVIYIATEAAEGIINRVCAYKTYYPDISPSLPFAAITSALNLRDASMDINSVISTIQQAKFCTPIKFIVIDTLSRAMAGGDENSSDAMGSFVNNMDRLQTITGAHVMIVHHLGKDEKRGARGHSLLHAAVDTEISVSRDHSTGISTALVSKQRELPLNGQFAYRLHVLELGKDQNGRPITSCVVEDTGPATVPIKPAKITGAAQVGLNQLKNCMADQSVEIPPSAHVPAGARGVTLAQWRGYLEKAGVINPEGNPREQFRRIRVTLQDRGYVGVWDNFVWLSQNVTGSSR